MLDKATIDEAICAVLTQANMAEEKQLDVLHFMAQDNQKRAFEVMLLMLDETLTEEMSQELEAIAEALNVLDASERRVWQTTVKFDEQTGEYLIDFPQEMLSKLGWQIGDTLLWTLHNDGSVSLTKNVDKADGTQAG